MIGSSALLACALVAQSGWSVSAGPERMSMRDISRTGPPADASPVEWRGSGPSLLGVYTREGVRRIHRVTVEVARASSFEYAGPLLSVSAPAADRALRVEGRYEYRRYFLDDLFVRGLDAGIGVQGAGRRLSYARTTSSLHASEVDSMVAIAGSVAARWHRSRRWSAEIAWTNGAALLKEHVSGAADMAFTRDRVGGGWLTDLVLGVTVRLADPWSLTASYLQTGEGAGASHASYALARRRIVAGVTYAR